MEAYAGQVVLGQEEERRHIAQELHDGPLQTLIHLCRQIDALEGGPSTVATTGDHGLHDGSMLASMRSSVEDTVATLRSIARGLRPSVLDDLGLVASINQVVTEATVRQGFESSFTIDGAVTRLPPAMELAVFRIAQEAVTDVERHAGASGGRGPPVRRRLIGLTVTDDGAGFDPRSQFWGDTQSLELWHERAGPTHRGQAAGHVAGRRWGDGGRAGARPASRTRLRSLPPHGGRHARCRSDGCRTRHLFTQVSGIATYVPPPGGDTGPTSNCHGTDIKTGGGRGPGMGY